MDGWMHGSDVNMYTHVQAHTHTQTYAHTHTQTHTQTEDMLTQFKNINNIKNIRVNSYVIPRIIHQSVLVACVRACVCDRCLFGWHACFCVCVCVCVSVCVCRHHLDRKRCLPPAHNPGDTGRGRSPAGCNTGAGRGSATHTHSRLKTRDVHSSGTRWT